MCEEASKYQKKTRPQELEHTGITPPDLKFQDPQLQIYQS